MTPYLTSQDVADQFKVSSGTVLRWIHEGKLTALNVGKVYRTTPDWVEEFIDRHTTDPAEGVMAGVVDEWFPRGGMR